MHANIELRHCGKAARRGQERTQRAAYDSQLERFISLLPCGTCWVWAARGPCRRCDRWLWDRVKLARNL